MPDLKYLVLQLDMSAPSRRDGRGVLTPVHADGHYRNRKDAEDVAKSMAEQFPNLRTYVVEVLK